MPLDDDIGGRFARLLEPFPEPTPCGEDLRQDISPRSLYFRLRDARAEARTVDRRSDSGEETDGGAREAWRSVASLAETALQAHGKDIEIAVWLTEGLVREAGFAGFAAGVSVLAGLVELFWERGLHPVPEPDDDRWSALGLIAGLSGEERDGTLVQPLRNVPLFRAGDGTEITLWVFRCARDLAAAGSDRRRAARAADKFPPFARLEHDARGAAREALVVAAAELDVAIAAWARLADAVSAVGAPTLPTSRIRDVLDEARMITRRYASANGAAPGLATPIVAAADGGAPRETTPTAVAAALAREQLFERVLDIAGIFREREPNSPFSLTLEEAVRRARLSLPELLREILPDDRARLAALSSLGIRADVAVAATVASPPMATGDARPEEEFVLRGIDN